MRLSAKTLKRLYKGALSFKEEAGWLTAYRYTKAQLDYMADPEYDWGWRMRAKFTGCCRIELKTDATKIAFNYKASHSHERANTIDLYVNGALTAIYRIGENLKGRVEFSLPEGTKAVTIYMANESELQIKGFELNGTYRAIKTRGKRLLIIGDSITQGAGPDFSSSAYADALQRKTGLDIVAQGIGGYRFEARDLMLTEGFEPDMVMVMLGTNYYEMACEENGYSYKRATIDFFNRLVQLYPSTPITVVTPFFRTNADEWERFLWCIDTIKGACAEHKGIRVIDGFSIMPCVAESLSDGVHPTAYASELIATALASELTRK